MTGNIMGRSASIERNTNETKIKLQLELDGSGKSDIATGVGFFDHMLELFTRHALIDLTVKADGDLHVQSLLFVLGGKITQHSVSDSLIGNQSKLFLDRLECIAVASRWI